jgi:branched-chain amino acid transport system permease protein
MKPALLVAGGLLALVPFGANSPFLVNLAMLTAVSAFMGQAWNIAGGFGGLTSFGHAAFFGLGAYTAAILQIRFGLSPWLGMPAAAIVGGGAGLVIGYAAFRAGLRGSYFALVTLAFAEVFRVLANSLDFTGAGLGLQIRRQPGFAAFQFVDQRWSYLAALALLALATLCAWHLRRSRFGARLAAVRESEDAAAALGIDVVRTKSLALAQSGALTALAGVLYAQTYLYIDPAIAFGPARSVEMLLVAMIGGAGTIWGPLLGALVLHIIADGARVFIDTPGAAPMLYGVLLLIIIWLLPGGIASLRARRAHA